MIMSINYLCFYFKNCLNLGFEAVLLISGVLSLRGAQVEEVV